MKLNKKKRRVHFSVDNAGKVYFTTDDYHIQILERTAERRGVKHEG